MEYVTLNNGIKMPKLGYGVYQTPAEKTERCVLDAIEVGYRAIDTAQAYGNEEGVGAALKKSSLPREEFFITTKVWITNAGYEKAKASIEESLKKLGTSYIDLLLIHQPFGDYYSSLRSTRLKPMCPSSRRRQRNTCKSITARSNHGGLLPRGAMIFSPTRF